MIKNILKQLWNQRKGNGWIATELFLVSIFLWIIADQMFLRLEDFNRPMGFNIDNTYLIKIDELPSLSKDYVSSEKSGSTRKEDLITIFSRIRKIKGVEELSASSCARPYSGCNAEGMYMAIHGNDSIAYYGMSRLVSPEYFKVFNIQIPDQDRTAGQIFQHHLVLSKDLADSLNVSRGDSVLDLNKNRFYIVDLCTPVRYAETWSDVPNSYMVIPETELIDERFKGDICIRLQNRLSENQRLSIWENIKKSCKVNNFSFFYSESYKELRKEYISTITNDIKSDYWYTIFLIVNIFLAVIGTFWFRTQQRRSEIGLRIAIGATRHSIFTLLISEGVILLSVIMLPAIIVIFNIWKLEILIMSNYSSHFFGMLITWLLMALMIITGIWYPARQAMKIKPAEALHEE